MQAVMNYKTLMNFHDISLTSIEGKPFEDGYFKGKKILIVNVASECGYTPQYAELQALYEQFQDRLIVLGCPCNDFGNQEPGMETDIQHFCEVRFGVTFPMTQKMSILHDPHPLYQWLCRKTLNGVEDYSVSWNFQKFLVDKSGVLVTTIGPGVSPLEKQILDWVTS